ncbi:zinc finger protein 512B isoform X2 [Tachyglossus aculeatus]|uniref:zinc finger protein 512B isoform X2 n=1 Tax=Tachyglossus aculeatus TaxID=9261 RepID=UPI0018F651C4|nr:zinc finger protein 512B isoform X2 [Tachyglossus aculeatus]
MADPFCAGGGRRLAGSSKTGAGKDASRTERRLPPAQELPNIGNVTSDKSEGRKKGRPKAENQELRDIPLSLMNQWKDEFKAHSRVKCPNSGCWLEFPSIYGLKYHYQRCQGGAISERLTYPCPYCEAAFTSKTQLEKHRLWNHMDRPVPASKPVPTSKAVPTSKPIPTSKSGTISKPVPMGKPVHPPKPLSTSKPVPTSKLVSPNKMENRLQKTVGRSSGKKRAAESSDSSPIHPKQVKLEKAAAQHPENGECALETREGKDFQLPAAGTLTAAVPTTKPSGCKDSRQGGGQASFPEEDPERMKHRRKQKTPKKFTGEQPSISGTFGLKGLAKVEDKAKAHRAKKLEGGSSTEDSKKKPPASSVKRETATYLSTASPEEQWQRIISEKGEVACPTCGVVTRKTVVGLKKHMDVCQKLQDALKCQHCKKQFKSKAGLNYHTMAEHVNKAVTTVETSELDEQEERERLRKVLKQMGKLKCPNEGCMATFSSLMGYQYHQKRCGKQPSEVENPVFTCPHCGKKYKSKAGHDYHVRSEHAAPAEEPEVKPETEVVLDFERTPSGRIRRTSAQVAVFHLQEIAEDELARDWTKRRMKDDLVPETKRLNYTRPGLPTLNPQLLETWKTEVKEKGHINCPNNCCEAIYSSVSGLKAHLANCNKGGHSVGKYRCLLCQKEFSSESGVKYHIIKTHSENWFRTAAESPPKQKHREQISPKKEKKKSTSSGKKRGRKPKERPPEASFPKSREGPAAKTHNKRPGAESQLREESPSSPGEAAARDKASQAPLPLHSRKGGASKMPEK